MIFNFNEVCNIAFCDDFLGKTHKKADVYLVRVSVDNFCVNLGSNSYTLNKEDVLIAASEPFAINVSTENGENGEIIGLSGTAAKQAAKSSCLPYIISDSGNGTHALAVLTAIHRLESSVNENAAPHHKSECVYAVLCALQYAFEEEKEQDGENLPLVKQAVSEIQKNYSGIYGVEELSDYLGVSKNHLVRVFCANMGEPPGKYLTKTRLNAAKQLLLNRDYSLEIIAVMCGFSGANYFCKVFKKYEGVSPSQYRDSRGAKQNASGNVADDVAQLEQALYI